jgi:hypothetical protein
MDIIEEKTDNNLDNYHNALKKYLELNKNYDMQILKQKKNIINNKSYSLKEKKRKIKSLLPKCVNCKRTVGSIFESDNNRYIALCGDKTNPCDLNILIKKPIILDIYEEYYKILENLDDYTKKIIELNNNLLFGFISEEDIKEDLSIIKNEYIRLQEDSELYFELFTNIMDNEDKRNKINENTEKLYNYIKDIKNIINEYLGTNNRALINDIVELYIKEVLPLQDEIRENKYSYINMEKSIYTEEDSSTKNNIYLIKKPITYEQREFIVEQASIRM